MIHLILVGAPGAGKGTQSSLLAERLGIAKIATGDILRAAVRAGTKLGTEAKRIMDAGELVPDGVILELVREALASEPARDGAVFDGFPRNVTQAEALESVLRESDRSLDAIVALEVPGELIVERMTGRRTDPETGEVYHLVHNPPPAGVAYRVIQRADDEEATVRHRLTVYDAATAPLVDFYEARGVPVHRVDGTRGIEAVQADILRDLGR